MRRLINRRHGTVFFRKSHKECLWLLSTTVAFRGFWCLAYFSIDIIKISLSRLSSLALPISLCTSAAPQKKACASSKLFHQVEPPCQTSDRQELPTLPSAFKKNEGAVSSCELQNGLLMVGNHIIFSYHGASETPSGISKTRKQRPSWVKRSSWRCQNSGQKSRMSMNVPAIFEVLAT